MQKIFLNLDCRHLVHQKKHKEDRINIPYLWNSKIRCNKIFLQYFKIRKKYMIKCNLVEM